jgi:lipoyl(octanoyl) transferase
VGLIFPVISSTDRRLQLYNLGIVPYGDAWQWQQSFVEQRRNNPALDDLLLLLEHPPVYTLGQGARLQFLKFDPNAVRHSDAAYGVPSAAVYCTERGGEVTYHCPGQLVGYPILNLARHRRDLHWYLRQLEEVLIQVLAMNGLSGHRLAGYTGVWLEGRKVAAIGIKVSRWITMHGFALNVCPDLSGFQYIVPCGIADKPVGSLAEFCPEIDPAEVRQQIIQAMVQVFDYSKLEILTQV